MSEPQKPVGQGESLFQANKPVIIIGAALIAGAIILAGSARKSFPDGTTGPSFYERIFNADDVALNEQVTHDITSMSFATELADMPFGSPCQHENQLFFPSKIEVEGKSCTGTTCDVKVSFILNPTEDLRKLWKSNSECIFEVPSPKTYSSGIGSRMGVTAATESPISQIRDGKFGNTRFHELMTYQKFDTGWQLNSHKGID